ncbi:MAG TPA: uracil-DNA glycosylase [Patescibacteria group bacterium]
MDKREKLKKLREEMLADESLPLRKGATNLVFGEGNADAKILAIGEGPGFHEDRLGRPFVGNAGNLLNKLLATIKLNREDVFITNMVFYRPPNNRDPFPNELKAFEKYMDQIIEIISPKVIITLGRFSMGKFLPDVKISSVHGRTFKLNFKGRGITVVPMYHPAAALRRNDVMEQIKADFLKLPTILKEATKPEIKQEGLF